MMRYEKPELAVLASAVDAVQGSSNKIPTHTDATDVASPAAYEADE
jgi:hypothetical protein